MIAKREQLQVPLVTVDCGSKTRPLLNRRFRMFEVLKFDSHWTKRATLGPKSE